MSSEGEGSVGGPDSTDRKKQTHLRCERQRREAINSGYAELKELLPPEMAPLGCKTTNASILFRACDFMGQLEKESRELSTGLERERAQAAALELIAAQYEAMSGKARAPGPSAPADAAARAKMRMWEALLEDWAASFSAEVSAESYADLTASLLPWLERLDTARAPDVLAKAATQQPHM